MSFVIMPVTFQFFSFAIRAQGVEPKRPCSSPATAMKTSVASHFCFDITRAILRTAATPEASSFGAGRIGVDAIAPFGLLARQSRDEVDQLGRLWISVAGGCVNSSIGTRKRPPESLL
jgi:hypothetical protein